ncbi:MAG: thioredoxin family protein [candidate division WOR-3 bacterium]|nr:MAG: thioredoxin family protein [candidate division WOR-3 bacterium]
MATKRKVEVFTAGCFLCDEVVKMVRSLACSDCEVLVYDLHGEGIDKAKEYGVNSVPTVVVDGKIVDCCTRGKVDLEALKAAGVGSPLGQNKEGGEDELRFSKKS